MQVAAAQRSRTAHAGDTVPLSRISYTNTNAVAALTNLVLVDTLPAGLGFAAAQPATTPAGNVVRWGLPDLSRPMLRAGRYS